MKSGIYKITSPSGRIYVGQTKDLSKRWMDYKYLSKIKDQKLICASIKCYGWEKHIFEILEVCNFDMLNIREIFWIDFLQTNRRKYLNIGLNLTDGGENPPSNIGREFKVESRNKVSVKNSINHSNKRIDNIKQYHLDGSLIKTWKKEEFNKKQPFKYFFVLKVCEGKSLFYKKFVWRFLEDDFLKFKINKKTEKPKKQKIKQRLKIKKGPVSEETKLKMSKSQKALWTEEKRKKQSLRLKGRKNTWLAKKQSPEFIEKRFLKIRKSIIQYSLEGNFIKEWISATEIENKLGYNMDTIGDCVKGKRENYKNYIWKYKDGCIKENL